jgi:DNA (cytosine-5)-methyltransferase 3A
MKVLSLFDGISCGLVALKRAGIPVSRYVAYEIDKYAKIVSKFNHPEIEQRGNVEGEDWREFIGFDMVIGGFPCTDLSIAGKRKGLKGDHSSLFWEQVTAIEIIKPKYFLVENNYGMPKEAEDIITKALGVEPILINSALVSAQQRKRLYWTNIPNLEQPEDKGILLKDIVEYGMVTQAKAYAITANFFKKNVRDCIGKKRGSVVAEPVRLLSWGESQSTRAYSLDGKSVCLDGSNVSKYFVPNRLGVIGKGGQGNRVYSVVGKSVCLSANSGGKGGTSGLYKIDLPDGDYIIRKLTPVECERLQTLPDHYTELLSDTQRYKCLGNGWTVDVIAHIFRQILLNEIM